MKIQKYMLFFIVFSTMNTILSQESLPFYQQYLISDKVLINPSYTGSTDDIVAKLTYHKQWANFDLSPNTQTAVIHANVVDRVGVGLYFFRDENGPVAAQGGNISFAYHIPLGEDEDRTENQFSFGTGFSLWSQTYNWRRIVAEDVTDPLLYGDASILLPYLQLGASFKYKGIFGGVSVTDIPLGNNTPIVNQIEPTPTWYYLNIGYDWKFAENFSIEPQILMNINTNSERQLDATFMAKYFDEDKKIAVGVSYRQDMDKNGNQALYISPLIKTDFGRLNFGFSYNLGLSDISTYGGNGFVMSIGYNIENFINGRGFRY